MKTNYCSSGKADIENAPIAFYSCNLKGQITYFNRSATRLWGRSPSTDFNLWCGALNVYNLDGTPLPLEEHPAVKAIQQKKFHQSSEIAIERPDHSRRIIKLTPQPDYDDRKELIGVSFWLLDISDSFQENVRQSTLSAIVESSDDAIITKNLSGIITSWNSGAQRIFGYTEEDMIGKHITSIIPESRLKEEDEIISRLKKGEKIDHFETRRIDKYGNLIPLSLTISPVRDIHGQIVGASKIARDLSEDIENQEKKSILSAIVESSDDAIISKTLEGVIMSWNRGAQQIFGYSENEAVGNSITMLIPEEKWHEETLILNKIRKGEKIDHFETTRVHKNGNKISVSITVSPVKDKKGNIIGASKVARDITLRVQTQEALERYSRNLEILNSVGKTISENLDVQEILQRVIDITQKLTSSTIGIFFYESKETGGKQALCFSGASENLLQGLLEYDFGDNFSWVHSELCLTPDIDKDPGNSPKIYKELGEKFGLKSYVAVPIIPASGKAIGGILLASNKKHHYNPEHQSLLKNIASQAASALQNSMLYEQVKELSEKKDEFIALASHELKTPLTTIKGYLQLLSHMNIEEKAALFLQKSLGQTEKLNTLIEDLLNMSRMNKGQLEYHYQIFDLRELTQEIVKTFEYSSKSHSVSSCLGEATVFVAADPQRIEQVIINLLTNAVKYSPHADKLKITLIDQDDQVLFKVRDFGFGLSQEQQEKLFQRFYRAESAKGINGLGIGLYLSKEIIHRHGGQIGVKSELGKGSEFYFSLPK